MNIVLLGAPASGKGTQAEMLAKKLNLYHLQTGDVARKLAESDARIKTMVDGGQLIPEEEMTMHVIDFLVRNQPSIKNILFEGFPRFISQYEALVGYLENKGDDLDAVISLEVSESEAVKRMGSRRICSLCKKVYNIVTNPPPKEGLCECGGSLIIRADDTPQSIKTRFQYYQANTKSLIDMLDQKQKLIRINGEAPIDEIHNHILSALKAKGLV